MMICSSGRYGEKFKNPLVFCHLTRVVLWNIEDEHGDHQCVEGLRRLNIKSTPSLQDLAAGTLVAKASLPLCGFLQRGWLVILGFSLLVLSPDSI